MYSCQSVTHYDCFCKFAYSVIVSAALQFVFFCDYHAGCNSHKGVDGTRDTPPFRGTFTCPWNVSLLTPSHRYRTSQVSGAFFFCLCGIVNPLEDFSGWKYFRNVLFIQTVHEGGLVLQSSQRSEKFTVTLQIYSGLGAGTVMSLGYQSVQSNGLRSLYIR